MKGIIVGIAVIAALIGLLTGASSVVTVAAAAAAA
jgi:hypothetical protein